MAGSAPAAGRGSLFRNGRIQRHGAPRHTRCSSTPHPVFLNTTIQTNAADASMGARIDPAQPLASVRGVCRKPASYSMTFDLLRILEPSKKAGLRIPAHFFSKMQEARVLLTILSASCCRIPASNSATKDVAVRHERTQEAESREPGPLS